MEASWVGRTPEEFSNQKEFTISFTMTGSVSVYARDSEEAREIVREMSNIDLLDSVEETEIE